MASDDHDAETIRELLDQAGLTLRIDADATIGDADHQPADSQTDKLGRYSITGHLGAGGMGEVLKVRDGDLGREIAAKVILGQSDQKALAKFVREAQITGQLAHPNIVAVHELGMTSDKKIYFTMKQAEGSMLQREDGPRPSSRRLVADIAVVRRKSA